MSSASKREDRSTDRGGLVEHRLARRVNALVLLDLGMSCQEVGGVLLLDDDTIRTWHRLFLRDGVDGLAGLNVTDNFRIITPESFQLL